MAQRKSSKPGDRNNGKLGKNSHKSGKQKKRTESAPINSKKRGQKDRQRRSRAAKAGRGKRPSGKKTEKGMEKGKQLKLDQDKKLISGCRIGTSRFTFVVKKLLGSGGFGDVYLVEDTKGKQYAVKTEYRDESVTPRLHFEVKAYTEIGKLKERSPEKAAHLVEMFDSACTDSLKYIVMTLLGPSIEDLIAKTEISWSTACRISIDMFEGLQELHSLGLVHRDVKPANYSIGLGPDKRRVFLVDLGMTTSYPTESSKMQNKSRYKFIGTLKYAPRAVHVCRRQTRCNDLEAWLYTSMEMFSADALPWRNVDDEKEVGQMKDEFFRNPKPVLTNVPARYAEIIKIIDATKPLQAPDYKELRNILMAAAKDEDTVFDEPFEWEDEFAKRTSKEALSKELVTNEFPAEATIGSGTDGVHDRDRTRDLQGTSNPVANILRSERTCEE